MAHEASSDHAARPNNPSAGDARALVAAALPTPNKFGIGPRQLLARANPRGAGSFVYVPGFEINGYRRSVVWFVLGEQVFPLNGSTQTITPHLPWPRERPLADWASTGIDPMDLTQEALALLFGRWPAR